MDILAQAQQLEAAGHRVIHLEVGEPDFTTPDAVKRAAKQAIDNDQTFYTPASGLPELRRAIADYYAARFSVAVDAHNILVTPGASGALQLALAAVVNPGQKVLMADPGYPCNRHFVRLLDGVAQPVAVDESSHYQLNRELIEANWTEQTVAVLLATPSNPTGTLVDRQTLAVIVQLVEDRGAVLVVDEIYQGLVYEQAEFSALELSRNLFVINSFSKYFSMTGWRLGWLHAPDIYVEPINRLAQNLFLAAPTVSQYAALAAFDPANLQQLDQQTAELKQRRDFLYHGLQQLGFKLKLKPAGAFYIYADVSAFSDNSFTFCRELLHQVHVAITPGLDFGEHHAQRYVRFAYTQPVEQLQIALQRIGEFLHQRT
jgi:aspartate/methionine/tyrosine aminotransferase